MSKHSKKRMPIKLPLLILMDVVLIGLALVVFSLFHHVIPRRQASLGIVSARPGAVAAATAAPTTVPEPTLAAIETTVPEPTTTAEPTSTPQPTSTPEPTPEAVLDVTQEPTPTPEPVGYFGTKFKDKFCEAGGARVGDNFQSTNLNITVQKYHVNKSNLYVADIYIRDISNLITVLAKDTYGRGITEWPHTMIARTNGLVAINGDYYGAHSSGVVIRNGTLYRSDNSTGADVCVLYWDGVMETYSPKEFDIDAVMARGAYQAWCFGPELLDENGKAMTKFNSEVTDRNPRTAIGYFEPGHYCFVVVEGRVSNSEGFTLAQLSAAMEKLGCVRAYNLDGGATSRLMCGKKSMNNPANGGRPCSDGIVIVN